MDLLISLVVIQVFVSLCSGVRYFKECNGDRKEVSIPLPDPIGKILEDILLFPIFQWLGPPSSGDETI